jgi:hypothetical protein
VAATGYGARSRPRRLADRSDAASHRIHRERALAAEGEELEHALEAGRRLTLADAARYASVD